MSWRRRRNLADEGWAPLLVSYLPLGLWIAAVLAAALAVLLGRRPIDFGAVADQLARYILIFPLGLQALWSFLLHVFVPEEAAALIGWEPSPFQYELGVAYLGIGLASLYAAFQSFQARAAVAVMAACFLGGAAVGHLRDITLGDAIAQGNSGITLYTQILTPILLLVLLLVSPRPKQAQPRAETSTASRIEAAMDQPVAEGQPVEPTPPAASIEGELEQMRQAVREQMKPKPAPEIAPPNEQALRESIGRSRRRKAPGGGRRFET